ncbi:MAG: ribosome maturation factor RimM [Clostridiales bacterium]
MGEYINIGIITNNHGLKGYLKVLPLTDDILRYKKLNFVYIKKDNINKYEVENVKFQNNLVLLKLKGIDDISETENYKNSYIMINKENAIELPEDSYFISDLLSCSVFDTTEGFLGKIIEVISTGSNDVYLVKDENGNERLVPALKKVVNNIDVKNKKIEITLMEGL